MQRLILGALLLMGVPPLALAQQGAASVALSTSVATQGYRLRSGDAIHVEVFEFPEISKDQLILPDGSINVMLLGVIRAAGRTPEELSQELVRRFQGMLARPVVAVNVLKTRPLRVNVVGEVLRPGPQDFAQRTSGNPDQKSDSSGIETLSSALALAGGVTPLADLRQVTILHQTEDGPHERQVDLWQALQSGDFSQDIPLSDGDTVKIPTLTQGDAVAQQMAQEVAVTTLAPRSIQVQVAGEVKNAGQVTIDPRSSVLNAISQAGGPTREADLGSILVARLGASGRVERLTVNYGDLIAGKSSFQVRNGDVIYVARDGGFQFADGVGAFLNPIGELFRVIFLGGRLGR
ncbi:polysaccharide biosynthesis/export family protein [Anthocerotibacter panamensis]|uniref:polysaccharide biosynthesis/export family protein n=1 Tax=Anthocerotibacter panamensis TaxID=2857077 RepID=UPI001C401E14|nr:polysaccharide biosynthesis/export family protein [Anthocerotibacter panamensis]